MRYHFKSIELNCNIFGKNNRIHLDFHLPLHILRIKEFKFIEIKYLKLILILLN